MALSFPSPIIHSLGICFNALQYINFTLSLAVGSGICSPVDISRPTIGMLLTFFLKEHAQKGRGLKELRASSCTL